jgi:hypothetical protein
MSKLDLGCGVGFSPCTLTEDEFVSRNKKAKRRWFIKPQATMMEFAAGTSNGENSASF